MGKTVGVVYRENLKVFDWQSEPEPQNHPLKALVTPDALFVNDNGAPGSCIAKACPGFQFYYAHGHIHVDLDPSGQRAECDQDRPLEDYASGNVT